MLDKTHAKIITDILTEQTKKRPVVGAAKAAATQKRVTQNVRAGQDRELEAAVPGIEEKSHQKVLDILQTAHKQLRAIFDSEATPHKIAALDTQHRLTSHLERAINSMTGKK